MAVNWNWKDKKGEVVWKKKATSTNPNITEERFAWSIYHANCMACMLYEYKENNEDMYKFMCYLNDTHHLKRMLGLEKFKGYRGTYIKEDWFKEIYPDYEIDYITLDSNYPYWDTLTKYFTQAGYEVRIYKGE